jgi:hypothetical protein
VNTENRRVSIAVFCLVLGTGGSAVAQGRTIELPNGVERDQLIDVIATTHGVAREGLTILSSDVEKLPLTGKSIRTTKAVDASGEVYGIVTDGGVNLADREQALAAEEQAHTATYGKLDARLAEKLAALGTVARPGLTLPVSIWVRGGDGAPNRPTLGSSSVDAAQATVATRIEQMRQQTAASRQSVVDALARMGVQSQQADFSPVVFAKLTPAQIRAIAMHPDVVTIYGQEEYRLFSDKASTTQRAYSAWLAGNTGRNVSARVVVHEPDGVADTNPYLNNLAHPVSYWCPRAWVGTDCTLGKNFDAANQHASEVAGTIASTHPLVRGMAPDVPLILSANSQEFNDAKLIRAAEWGIASGGAVTNMSWGTICGGFQDVQSRWVDWATKNLWHTFVIAAGNHPAGCASATDDEKVSSPGLAWNAITVGSIADNSTGFWTGDAMSAFSDWRNPDFAPSMVKPEVVAVGQDVQTTDLSSDWLTDAPGVNGTSFAAPMVAGQVAQIVARYPALGGWPEIVKATVLVSAFHDIETGIDRDGLGAVVMNVGDTTARNGWSRGDGVLQAASFPWTYANVINATAGQVIRVAMAWDSWSDGSASDQLGADLDLVVKRGDTGATVCSSASTQNAWELCSFTAPVTGTYTIVANRFSSVTGWPGTYLGVAWGVQAKPNFCSAATTVAATGGTFNVNTANGSTYFDSYPAPAPTWNERGRERVYKLVLATTKDITATLTNPSTDLDVFVVQAANCAADPQVPVAKGGGESSVFVDNAPAGTYYIVVDGYNGAVGSASMNVSVTGP